ncbi:MAG: hypothetical protein IZT58_05175 [Actinobacteria bacterium]|nr:hypothetical protein [Actinomycetota bacterium]
MSDPLPAQSDGDQGMLPQAAPQETPPPPPPPPPAGVGPPTPPLSTAPPTNSAPLGSTPAASVSSGSASAIPVPTGSAPSLAPVDPRAQPILDPDDLSRPFAPLRSDPPPQLYSTWWLRYSLFLTLLVAIAVVLLTEYGSASADLATQPLVVATHLLAAVLLVSWSALAMLGAGRLVPSTHYNHRASAPVVVLLWLIAFLAPFGAFRVADWARDRFSDPADDVAVVMITVAAVMICFILVWLPFRYHARQGHRIGAPSRPILEWFWAPLFAAIGGIIITAFGLHDLLLEDGLTASERTLQVAVLYGLPAFVFALSTWRATTVIDEVVDIRWRTWRSEWDQTLHEMAAQPTPGPELGDQSE